MSLRASAREIASQPLIGPERTIGYDWSPDSKWLAYAMNNKANISTGVRAFRRAEPVIPGQRRPRDVSNPAFDKSGKYLFFLASTDAGPVIRDLYRALEPATCASPQRSISPSCRTTSCRRWLAGATRRGPKACRPCRRPSEDKSPGKDAPFRIDFEGLEFRILDLPIPPGDLSNLQAGSAGQIYYLKTVDSVTSLNRYDLTTRKNETLFPAIGYVVSADGKKTPLRQADNWSIVPTTRRVEPTEGRIPVDSIEVRIDPLAEWKQIFDEAWRINRDYFYAPNMHGVDWKKQRDKYAAFLPHLATRADLNRILQWMSSELSVSHHRVDGGDALSEPKSVPVRTARRRLRGGERPLPAQEGVRRTQLGSAAARATDRARCEREGG